MEPESMELVVEVEDCEAWMAEAAVEEG